MSLDTALKAHLDGQGGLSALVGTRGYPVRLAQGTALPAYTYQRIDAPREQAFGRRVLQTNPRYQFTAWGATFIDARAVAVQLRAALLLFTGESGNVKDLSLSDGPDDVDPQTLTYWSIVDALMTVDGDA
jgi:hypothetical protein